MLACIFRLSRDGNIDVKVISENAAWPVLVRISTCTPVQVVQVAAAASKRLYN